jgi:hypothetical protein
MVSSEPTVAGEEPVVPHAGGDVGHDVGVELVLLDPVFHVVLVPGPVGALDVDQPVVGPLGLGDATAEREGHGGLDVVPRIGVAAGTTAPCPRGAATRRWRRPWPGPVGPVMMPSTVMQADWWSRVRRLRAGEQGAWWRRATRLLPRRG